MTHALDGFDILPRMPSWVTPSRPQTLEDAAFLSGAALGHLHLVLTREDVPQNLLRARLAVQAAEQCVLVSGRSERAKELRDAVAFLHPGDHPGPAGQVYRMWQRVVEKPFAVKALFRALPDLEPEQIAVWLDAGQGTPVARAAGVLDVVLRDMGPRDPATALVLADVALAHSLRWTHVVPLLALGLKRSDLRASGDALRLACHGAVVTAASEAARAAVDLSRRFVRLQSVAPKLRARGAEEAVAQFLTRDAVAPADLTSLRSPRAARRFCDRLVDLGAVRELTGRATFRLYGV